MLRHIRPSAHTSNVLRFLRAVGPLPHRRRKVPPQAQPDAIRLAYYKALLPFIHQAQKFFHDERPMIIRLLQEERQEQGKMDAARGEEAQRLVDRAARRAAEAFRPHELAEVAKKFGKQTSDFQQKQLDKQVRAAMGVSLSAIEKPITDKLEGFAAVNVDLIVTVPERYFDRIRQDVLEAFDSGMTPATLAEQLIERDGMSENDAMRIARDQIGKLAGQMNEARQVAMGVSGYTWRGAMDNRERDEHRELEGEHFEWSDPPDAGTDGEPCHPGEAIQCRCTAEPDFSDILGDAEEPTASPED